MTTTQTPRTDALPEEINARIVQDSGEFGTWVSTKFEQAPNTTKYIRADIAERENARIAEAVKRACVVECDKHWRNCERLRDQATTPEKKKECGDAAAFAFNMRVSLNAIDLTAILKAE